MKKDEDALKSLNQSILRNEEYGKAYFKRGEIHLGLGNYEEAANDFKRVESLEPGKFDTREKL